jgi:hypothetical protein
MTSSPDILPKTFHCRRCHREVPMDKYIPHYKSCPGFSSKCYEKCPPTPPEPVERTVAPYEP